MEGRGFRGTKVGARAAPTGLFRKPRLQAHFSRCGLRGGEHEGAHEIALRAV